MKIKEIAFIGYPVTNISNARNFYENTLGLTPEMEFQFPDDNDQWWIEYDINGIALAISNTWPPSGQSGPALAFEVDDIDAWITALKKNNVSFYLEMKDTPVCRFAGILDPDGNPLMIHQHK